MGPDHRMSPDALRILHCIPSIWSGSGGPSRAVLEMCRALSAVQPAHRSDIATTDYGLSEEWLRYVRSRAPDSTRIRVFSESTWLDKGWSMPLARWLWHCASEYDLVHIHALFSSTSSIGAWVCRQREIPYVIRPLGTLSPYTFANRRKTLKRVYYQLIERRTLKNASAIQFTTLQECKKADRLRIGTRTVVVPIPYDLAGVRRISRPKDPTVLFLSRLHPVKGIELLLEAMVTVRQSLPSVRLIIAGSGDAEYELSLGEMTRELELETAVIFAGFVEGPAKEALFERATVFALPSHQENFGVAVTEALARGIPVVVTEGVDLADDIKTFRSGYVASRNAGEVADALLKLLVDPELGAVMGENGRRQVSELYAPLKVGHALQSLYRSCIDGASRI